MTEGASSPKDTIALVMVSGSWRALSKKPDTSASISHTEIVITVAERRSLSRPMKVLMAENAAV